MRTKKPRELRITAICDDGPRTSNIRVGDTARITWKFDGDGITAWIALKYELLADGTLEIRRVKVPLGVIEPEPPPETETEV